MSTSPGMASSSDEDSDNSLEMLKVPQITNDSDFQIDKLTSEKEFDVWRFQVTILLKAKGVYHLVNEKKKPKDRRSLKIWYRDDARVQLYIIRTLGEVPLSLVMGCDTAAEMWKRLSSVFEKTDWNYIEELRRKFFGFRFNEDMDIRSNLAEMEKIYYKLLMRGESVDEDMKTDLVLAGLPAWLQSFPVAWRSTAIRDKTYDSLMKQLITQEAYKKVDDQVNYDCMD